MLGGGLGGDRHGDEYLALVECGGGGEIVMGFLREAHLLFFVFCTE